MCGFTKGVCVCPTRIFSNALSYCKFATSLKRRFNSSLFRFRFQALIEAFNFSDDLAVIPNLLSVGKSGDHVCPICNSRFTNIGNFKQHMKTHDTDHLRDQRNQIISEMVATCYGDLLWFLLLVLLDEITTTVKVETATGVNWGGCHNSVVSSVPTILGLRVWNCCCWNEKRTKINEKEDGIGPYFKKTSVNWPWGSTS